MIASIAASAMLTTTARSEQARVWDGQWDPPTAAAALLDRARGAQSSFVPFFSHGGDWQYDRLGFGACYLIQVAGPDGPRLVRACP